MKYITDTKRNKDKRDTIYWENPRDPYGNVAVIFANQSGGLTVSVCETHAMDSYNQEIESTAYLPKEVAERLRDLLNDHFPKK